MNTVAATEESTAEPAAAGSRELCDAVEIEAQLHRLCRYNSLVSVRRAGDTRSHPSAVLLVQNLLHRAVIDALPDELSVPGTILQLRTRFDGAELLFCSTVLGRMLHDGAPALAIAIPSGIRLHERRAARRLPVAAEPQLPTSTARLDETAFRFEITDVSVHGAGGTAHNAPVLMVGDRLELTMELPGSSLPLRAEVRMQSGSSHSVRLGLRFIDLRPHHLDRLSTALARIERRDIRSHIGH